MKENETINVMNAEGFIEKVPIKFFLNSLHGENNNVTNIIEYTRKEVVREIFCLIAEWCMNELDDIKIVEERASYFRDKELYMRCKDSRDYIQSIKSHLGKMLNKYIKEEQEPIKCKDCKHLMFSDCYGECSKGYKGIVKPDDYCEHAEREEQQ